MSRASERQYGCTRKVRYGTKAEAERDVLRIAKADGDPLNARRIYSCKWCGHWHLARRVEPERWRVALREFDTIRMELGGRVAQWAIRENYGPARKRERAVRNLALGAGLKAAAGPRHR